MRCARLVGLIAVGLASCVPATPTIAPTPDPVLTARIDALEARQTQLLVALARLEERLAMPRGDVSAPALVRQEPAAATSVAPTAAPMAPASAPQRGPKGGCYVITGSGKKRYVSRDRC